MKREYTEASDAALVVSIGRYQQAALAEAYRRHAGATFGLAKRLLNDHARAEEVVQEVFVLVSCDPVSLARDVTLMAAAGYMPERVEVLDLFPNTHHVETVTRFVSRGS